MRSFLMFPVSALVAGACSSTPTPQLLDGGFGDAGSPAQCLIPPEYGVFGSSTGTPDLTVTNSLTVVLDPGPPKDDFFIKLVTGKGVFAGGLKTGTFPIAGVDATSDQCGLCTNIIADVVTGQGPTKFYLADAGTITLTSATVATSTSPSMISGSAQNLHFVEYDLDTGQAIPNGCSSTIASIMFGM